MTEKVLTLGVPDGQPPVPAVVTGYFEGNRVGSQVLVTGSEVEGYVERGLVMLLGVEREPAPEEEGEGADEPSAGQHAGPAEAETPAVAPAGELEGQMTVDDAVAASEVPATVAEIRRWLEEAPDETTRRARARAALEAEQAREEPRATVVRDVRRVLEG